MILFLLGICYCTLILRKSAEKPTVIWLSTQNCFKSTVSSYNWFLCTQGLLGKRRRRCQRFLSWFHWITPTRGGYLWHTFVVLLTIWANIAFFFDSYSFLHFYNCTSGRQVSGYFSSVLHLLKVLLVTNTIKMEKKYKCSSEIKRKIKKMYSSSQVNCNIKNRLFFYSIKFWKGIQKDHGLQFFVCKIPWWSDHLYSHSISGFVAPSVHPSVHSFVHLSVHSSIHSSLPLSICLSDI